MPHVGPIPISILEIIGITIILVAILLILRRKYPDRFPDRSSGKRISPGLLAVGIIAIFVVIFSFFL